MQESNTQAPAASSLAGGAISNTATAAHPLSPMPASATAGVNHEMSRVNGTANANGGSGVSPGVMGAMGAAGAAAVGVRGGVHAMHNGGLIMHNSGLFYRLSTPTCHAQIINSHGPFHCHHWDQLQQTTMECI